MLVCLIDMFENFGVLLGMFVSLDVLNFKVFMYVNWICKLLMFNINYV